MTHLTLGVAFAAGVVSFLAPCVLPLIPGFLAYLSGTSLGDSQGKRLAVFLNSACFVLGFSVVFAVLGVLLNTLLEQVAYDVQIWLSRVGGAVIIIFGLYLAGLLKLPFLEREYKVPVRMRLSSRYLTSFVFGAAFAVGWTPCVGAALGSILGLAAARPGSAFSLLLAYALGLGVPFLLVGAFLGQASRWIQRNGRWLAVVNRAFGILLVGLGILVFTQSLNRIANFELLNRFLLR